MAKILVSIQNGNINKQIKTTWKIHEMVLTQNITSDSELAVSR